LNYTIKKKKKDFSHQKKKSALDLKFMMRILRRRANEKKYSGERTKKKIKDRGGVSFYSAELINKKESEGTKVEKKNQKARTNRVLMGFDERQK
jgi:hypothetical protein